MKEEQVERALKALESIANSLEKIAESSNDNVKAIGEISDALDASVGQWSIDNPLFVSGERR